MHRGEAQGYFRPLEILNHVVEDYNPISFTNVVNPELKAYIMEKGVQNGNGLLFSEIFTSDPECTPFLILQKIGVKVTKPYMIEYNRAIKAILFENCFYIDNSHQYN